MPDTKIEWADQGLNFYTWNCVEVSPGCKNCYAHARSKQYPQNSAGGTFHAAPAWRANALEELRKTKGGQVVFVNTHSDTFHERISLETLRKLFTHLNQRQDLIFLLLTKRPEVALKHAPYLTWGENIWLGTSIESNAYLHRARTLLQVPAKHRFLSLEPLLEMLYPFDLSLGIGHMDWVIAGGESGEKRRPFDKRWVASIRDICQDANVPFFFKQGSALYPGLDRELDGRTWEEQPVAFEALRAEYAMPKQGMLF